MIQNVGGVYTLTGKITQCPTQQQQGRRSWSEVRLLYEYTYLETTLSFLYKPFQVDKGIFLVSF